MIRRPPRSTLFSLHDALPISIVRDPLRIDIGKRHQPVEDAVMLGNDERVERQAERIGLAHNLAELVAEDVDRKSTRLNSSHSQISYAVFCLTKKTRC